MKTRDKPLLANQWVAVLCFIILTACGGGQDNGNGVVPSPPPSPPPPPPALGVTFASEAFLLGVPGSGHTGESRLIKSPSEFATITPALYPDRLPSGFQEPDYGKNYLLYLTHKPLRQGVWNGWTRVEHVESTASGNNHVVHAELCLQAVEAGGVDNAPYRPYAFYTTNRIEGQLSVLWTERTYPNCLAFTDHPPPKLQTTFTAEYGFYHQPEVDAPGQSLVIKSPSEFATIPPARFPDNLPPGFTQPDYTKNYLLYIDAPRAVNEGLWRSWARIERIESSPDHKSHIVLAELCLLEAEDGFGYPIYRRPYAFYATNKIEGAVEVRWTERVEPNCLAFDGIPPSKLEARFASDSRFTHLPDAAQPGQSLLIKSASEFATIPPARFPGQLPTGFQEPDYRQNYLLYLDGKSIDSDVWRGWARIERVRSTADGRTHIVFAELCLEDVGGSFGFPQYVRPYALYSTNRIQGTVEVRWTERTDGDCFAYPP